MIRRFCIWFAVMELLTAVMCSGAALKSIPITQNQLDLLIRSYLQNAAASWRYPYRFSLSQEADPYETNIQRNQRVDAALDSSLMFLSRLYDGARTWQFEMKLVLPSLGYDPNTETAQVQLPELGIPSSAGKSQVMGLMSGHRAPHLFYALEPLWKHKYLHNSIGKRHFLEGSLSVHLPIDKARALDIVNNPGVISVVLQFGTVHLVDGTTDCERPVDFPALKMLSANWVVGSDTLYRCSPDNGTSAGALIVPGEPRLVGTSPSVKVKYAFEKAIPPFDRTREIHGPLMEQLGLDIDAVNSAYYADSSYLSGFLKIRGLTSDTKIVLDGTSVEGDSLLGPLAKGWHNMRFAEPCAGHQLRKIKIKGNDTLEIAYATRSVSGTWIPYWSTRGNSGDQYRLVIAQTGNNLAISFQGKTYQTEPEYCIEFWDRIDAQVFPYKYGEDERTIHINGCLPFNFGRGSIWDDSYDRFYFFLSDDGEQLVGREVSKSSGHLGGRLHPKGEVGKPIVLVRSTR